MRTVFIKYKKPALLVCLGWLPFLLSAQNDILSEYVRTALENSPELHRSELALQKDRLSHDLVKSYKIPTAAFQLGYQTSAGGRSIDLPVGDMLNGVYSTLNNLTGQEAFPMIDNERIRFFPTHFYDAKIRTSVPIYNPEVKHNLELAALKVEGAKLDYRSEGRDLVLRVKEAYFNYLMADQALEIYQNTLELAQEGLRVNQSLLKNGKGLPAYILRSEAETESLKAEIYQAGVNLTNAKAWFNFLLSQPESSPIRTEFDVEDALEQSRQLLFISPRSEDREEIKSLENATKMYHNMIALQKSERLPRINSILDLGSQAERWQINSKSPYFLLGIQLEVPIFSASRTQIKAAQTRLELQQNESRTAEAEKQIRLAGEIALRNLEAAFETLAAQEKQMEAARSYRRLIEKGYTEGVSSFIETIDARNQWMRVRLNHQIQIYRTLQTAARAERELALYSLDFKN